MRKTLAILVLVALLVMLATPQVNALYVFDGRNYSANMKSVAQQIKTVAHEYQQVKNQLTMLQNDAKNLDKMDQKQAKTTMYNIQVQLGKLQSLQQEKKGIGMDYQTLQQDWDANYKDFADFNGMSGQEYADQANNTLEQTNLATYDAMRSQGLVAQIGDDAGNLQNLMAASNTSKGALAAAQAGNQIAAINAQQLMRLQEIVASSSRAQSAYQADLVQRDAMAKAMSEKAFSGTGNPQKGQGPGIMH